MLLNEQMTLLTLIENEQKAYVGASNRYPKPRWVCINDI